MAIYLCAWHPSNLPAAQEEELQQLRASAGTVQQAAEAATAQAAADQEAAVQQAVAEAVEKAAQPVEQLKAGMKELESKLKKRRQQQQEAEREAAALKKRAKEAEEGLARAQEALQVC